MFTKLAGAAAIAAASVTASLALGLAGVTTASAESIGVTDPDDTPHGVDLRAVHIENTDTFVRITLSHTDLRRSPASGAGGAVYLDTDKEDNGPELVFVGGYFEGTDYQLLETEGFGPAKWGSVVDGSWRMRLNYDKERTIMRMSRGSVGADKIRVAVKVAGTKHNGTHVTDWLGEPKSFTSWVARD